MKIGDIDIANSIVNLEYDLYVVQQLLEHIYKHNPTIKAPTPDEIQTFKDDAIKKLIEKYPSMGISKK